MSRSRFFPPALARLFAGTSIASGQAQPQAHEDDDREDEGGRRQAPAPQGLSDADSQRIRANAEQAVTEATDNERTRWATVLNATTGEGDDAASIGSQPSRAAVAIDLLADTDMDADKIIATASKPAYAGAPPAATDTDPHAIAAQAARERLRTQAQPDTGAGANGGGAGGDGGGAGGGDPMATVRANVAKRRQANNDRIRAQAGLPAPAAAPAA